MVSSIVGNYLMEKGLLTGEQFRDILNEQQKVRVKLGLIAVAEGLMTQEEADRVNQLQAVMDRRFGDIAVEKGYLTEGQVNSLLKKQGNAYLRSRCSKQQATGLRAASVGAKRVPLGLSTPRIACALAAFAAFV